MFSSVFGHSSKMPSASLMQKMRRTSGHVSLVCALLLAGAVTPAWSKPGKPAAAKASTSKTSKNQAAKGNSASANRKGNTADKKSANATPTSKKGTKTSTKGSAHADAAPAGRNNKQARANNALAANKTVAAQSKARGKNEEKIPSSKDLHKQIAALQAKGKGKGRQLSKTQKQQLARLMAQAQQAEKLERQEKMEQARALRLAAAQKERQQQQAKALLAARAAPVETAAPPAIPPTSPQQPVVANTALQEDLMALQANGTGSTDNSIGRAQSAAAVAVVAPTPAVAPAMAQMPGTPSALATQPATATAAAQEDPLQALLAAKLASPAVASATPVATAPAVAPTAPIAKTAAPVVLSSPAPATPSAPAVAVATTAALERKPEAAPSPIIRVSVPQRGSLGQIQGLSPARGNFGPELYSNVAFAMDQKTGQVLVNKNGHFVSPVASITKLMTAVITMDANLPMDEMITITDEDVDRLKGSRSRLAVGTTLSRQELLHLALMSSENRAAHALGRTYPGGLSEAIRAMNRRALMLGMRDTRYVEPTGLSSANQSSAHDLALLVKAAYRYPLIRNYTTYPGAEFAVQGQMMRFNNTNRLIHSPEWNIGLQKTGYISEAGRCVVMQSNIGGRNVIIVLLDSAGTNRRAQDVEAIRYWVQQGGSNRLDRDGSSIIAHARTY